MPLVKAKYEQEKIDSLKCLLRREAEKGRAKDYEIEVDGFKVVSRTDNVEEFDDFELHLRDTTRYLTIKIFDGPKTHRNTQYVFSLSDDMAPSLNGPGSLGEVGELIKQKLEDQSKEYQLERLREKLAEKETALEEAEEYNEQLAEEIRVLKENKYNLGSFNIAEIGAEVLKYTIAKNVNKSPLAANLSGILGALNTAQEPMQQGQKEEEEYEATIEEAEDQPTPQQLAILHSIQRMEQVFSAQQLQTMTQMLRHLMEHPADLMPVAELLNIKTSDNGKV